MKKLFLFTALFVAAAFSSCEHDGETPDPQPLAIAFAEGNSLQFDVDETKIVHYTITGGSDKTVVKAELKTPNDAYIVETASTSTTEGMIAITANTPEAENYIVVTVSDDDRSITAEIAVSTNPISEELAIAFAEGNSLEFDAGETKIVHYTITGGHANNVVKVELQNPDGAYALSTTPTSATEGTIKITAKVPTDNRVIVTVSDGSQTIMAAIDVTVILRPSFDGKTIVVETPGTLAKLLADYDETTITELTVIGNLSSWDILTLRNLPNLAILDMEHVNLEELSSCAFSSNASLTSVKLPLTLKTIGDRAFSGCSSLKSITIPDSVTSIEGDAFNGCSSLTGELVIPDSVTEIGANAFYRCRSLTSVTIGNSVTSIGSYAFVECNSLTGAYITDIAKWCAIEFMTNGLSNPLSYAHNLYLNGELVTDLVIPNSVTSISMYAFEGCSLKSVTIPNSVTSIGHSAFRSCSDLTSVTIPDSVTEIGECTFEYCSSLISVTIPNSVTSIGSYAFHDCSSLTSVTIPNSVTSIGSYAFHDCSSLTSVTIPDSVTEIGYSIFYQCSNLTNVTMPKSTTEIKNCTFVECNLTDFPITENITKIGYRAFYKCPGPESVTIPAGVTEVGQEAFMNCKNLKEVYCKATVPPSCTKTASTASLLLICYSNVKLYVPVGTAEAYKAADGWKEFSNIVEMEF